MSVATAFAIALLVLCRGSGAQTASDGVCILAAPSFTTSAPNIFSDRQEQDLGDALAEMSESDLKIAPPAPDDQLTEIGEKLLATLPPTGIHYRFRIYDSGEVDGFSLAGGRVYISRKLIAAVKNQDELAGVLAHELGHLSTHQTAIEMTYLFKVRMGVTQVGDRDDIFAKVHRLMSTPAKENEAEEKEEKDQLVADHVAMYAIVRAGYAPQSFASFLNESMMNKGKTGSWLSDIFGLTHEASQRYRRALKLIAELPAGCANRQPQSNEAFSAWRRALVEERIKDSAGNVSGDTQLKLDPPLRPSMWNIRFSQDGRFLLAQDEGSIAVIALDSRRVLFRIDAPDAQRARFTPDSASVVFNDSNLRVERWDVTSGKRVSVKEMVIYDGCNQTLLSPDGKSLACITADLSDDPPRLGLRLFDVESNKPFFEKPKFFVLGFYYYATLVRFFADAMSGTPMVDMAISPDGRYLLAVAGQDMLAYDLESRQPVAVGGKLKGLSEINLTFVGPTEVFAVGGIKGGGFRHGLLMSFPDGRLLKDVDIGNQWVQGVTRGHGLIMGPVEDYPIVFFDLDKAKILAGSKLQTMDAWDNRYAAEDAAGGVQLGQIGSPITEFLSLPVGPLPSLQSAAFSPDGRYLAFSMRNRSAIWNLETGKQFRLMRPFRSAWIDKDDTLWTQFPKFLKRDQTEMSTELNGTGAKELYKYEDQDSQYRNLQLRFRPMGKETSTRIHSTLEVKKMDGQTVLWKRDFPHDAPVCWPADGDRLILAWDLGTGGAKDEMKSHPQLEKQAEALKDHKKGLLLETVVPETGAALEQVVVPEVDLSKGWDDERRATVSGDFVLVRGEHGNTVIYRLDTGAKVGEFFGSPVATDGASGLVAAVNRENEILLVDERTGKELRRFALGQPVRLAEIMHGKTLLVLTADHMVHRIPLGQ